MGWLGGGGNPWGILTTLTMAGSSGGGPTETTGMGGIGTFMVTFVLAVEFVGPRYELI